MEVKLGSIVVAFHRGRKRRCTVLAEAPKATRNRGERYVWLSCTDEDITGYYSTFLKPVRLLEVVGAIRTTEET